MSYLIFNCTFSHGRLKYLSVGRCLSSRNIDCMYFFSEGGKGLISDSKRCLEFKEGFLNQLEEKSGNSSGGRMVNDYGIPKAWGVEWFGIPRARGD